MKKIALGAFVLSVALIDSANALQYTNGRSAFKFNISGTAGMIEPDFETPLFLGDFDVRAQYNYAVASGQTLGLVYEYDATTLDEHDYAHDAFVLWEIRDMGRIEVGLTDSVARKLSVGIPDVGGLRVNHKPLFYKKISPDGVVIPNTSVSSGHDAPRINIATIPTQIGQYGVSVSGFGDDVDYSVDLGAKFRFPDGKIKTALSLGASFMDNLRGYSPASYTPDVFADWRAQGSVGFNLQYNSWIWGTSVLGIYDKNPVGVASDGISAGTGVSYDVLNYSVSLSYMYSHTGIWHDDMKNYYDHTGIASFRYKYSENVSVWSSIGITSKTPFLSAALKVNF